MAGLRGLRGPGPTRREHFPGLVRFASDPCPAFWGGNEAPWSRGPAVSVSGVTRLGQDGGPGLLRSPVADSLAVRLILALEGPHSLPPASERLGLVTLTQSFGKFWLGWPGCHVDGRGGWEDGGSERNGTGMEIKE